MTWADAVDYADDLLDYRAEVISEAETALGAAEAQRIAWARMAEDGVLSPSTRKMWVAVRDNRVELVCEGLDGQVVDLDELFETEDGDTFSGPPEPHIGCRCSVVLVEGEEDAASLRLLERLGDEPGHPFRGNQWTSGAGEEGKGPDEDVTGTFKVGEVRVNIEAPAARSMRSLGLKRKDVVSLVGTPGGADAQILVETTSISGNEDALSVDVSGEVGGSAWSAYRTLGTDEDGKKVVWNESQEIDPPGHGLGAQILEAQVIAAAAAGFDRIETIGSAARLGNTRLQNGYYTWPRLGFDGPLPKILSEMPAGLRGAKRVSDLMTSPEGRAWWKENGSGIILTFDLKPGSLSRRVLSAYMSARRGERHGDVEGHPFRGNQWTTGQGGGDADKDGPRLKLDDDAPKALSHFGLSAPRIATMLGAGAKDEVQFETHDKNRIMVTIRGDGWFATRMLLEKDGKRVIKNMILEVDKKGLGKGTQILAKEVEAAAAAGFDRIDTFAVGDATMKNSNGYYTWPRLGFDGPIDNPEDNDESSLVNRDAWPKALRDAEKLSDLMKTEAGRRYWKSYGQSRHVSFDLKEGSLSRRIFDAYLREKRKRESHGEGPGHPFRGNQWTSGSGGADDDDRANQKALAEAQTNDLARTTARLPFILGEPGYAPHEEIVRYIAAYGQEFEAQPLPADVDRGAKRACYRNATMLVMKRGDLDYVEGVAYAQGLPYMHAWAVDRAGKVVDPTWDEPEKSRYFGVRYERAPYLQHLYRAKMFGVLGADNRTTQRAIRSGIPELRAKR